MSVPIKTHRAAMKRDIPDLSVPTTSTALSGSRGPMDF
jgi:hypothetical protein